jgi:hypothetical protein
MKASPMLVSLDSNEMARPRAAKIEKAVLADKCFAMRDPGNHPFDVFFQATLKSDEGVEYIEQMHAEIKDFSEDANSDYLASILNGHLWEQVLAARELQEPLVIVVTGDDNDVGAAIRKAASRESNGHQVDPEKLMQYFRMVEGFEANCIGQKVQVWRLKTDPFGRMLLRVRKILEGGNLSGFAPAPAEDERQVVGLSILAGRGFGSKKSMSILEKFRICLQPKLSDNYLTDCDGIGEKLALQLAHSENIMVPCQNVCRPKAARKAKA